METINDLAEHALSLPPIERKEYITSLDVHVAAGVLAIIGREQDNEA